MFCYNILKMKRKIRPVPPGLTQGAAFIRGRRLLILCRSQVRRLFEEKFPTILQSSSSEIQRVVPKSHCGRDLVKQTAHGILGNSCFAREKPKMADVKSELIVSSRSEISKTKHSEYVLDKISDLWESKILTDISLKVQGKVIKAHKLVLTACSDYFRPCLPDE